MSCFTCFLETRTKMRNLTFPIHCLSLNCSECCSVASYIQQMYSLSLTWSSLSFDCLLFRVPLIPGWYFMAQFSVLSLFVSTTFKADEISEIPFWSFASFASLHKISSASLVRTSISRHFSHLLLVFLVFNLLRFLRFICNWIFANTSQCQFCAIFIFIYNTWMCISHDVQCDLL